LAFQVAIFTTKIIKKSTQISELFTFQMSEAAAWCSTAMGMKNTAICMKKYALFNLWFLIN
jgi:hypothetical protein